VTTSSVDQMALTTVNPNQTPTHKSKISIRKFQNLKSYFIPAASDLSAEKFLSGKHPFIYLYNTQFIL